MCECNIVWAFCFLSLGAEADSVIGFFCLYVSVFSRNVSEPREALYKTVSSVSGLLVISVGCLLSCTVGPQTEMLRFDLRHFPP